MPVRNAADRAWSRHETMVWFSCTLIPEILPGFPQAVSGRRGIDDAPNIGRELGCAQGRVELVLLVLDGGRAREHRLDPVPGFWGQSAVQAAGRVGRVAEYPAAERGRTFQVRTVDNDHQF